MAHDELSPLVVFCQKSWRRFVRLLGRAAKNKDFRRFYIVFALAVLFGTATFWAVLGARLQVHNADQLSDPYMFDSWKAFHGASFPGSHTFLLKWPIFWLLGLVGITATSLLIATLAVVLVTVAVLAFILYKIDRRPLVFGTVCLALSLALLLVPGQPYAGGILPVNMAMLTTRNLEYAVYLGVLVCFARAPKLRNWKFAFGTLLLALLIASDKLFLSLSAGGALLALVLYALLANWSIVSFAVRWLIGTTTAAVVATGLLIGITATHLTHLAGTAAATPYGVIRNGKNAVLGVAYAVLGLFTNVGANPAYDNKVLSDLPGAVAHRLWSLSGLAYLAAVAVLVYAAVLVWRVVRPTFKSSSRRTLPPTANLLALSLIWSTIAALGVFVATQHYYAVDARYLTIALFAVVVSASVALRKLHWRWPEDLLLLACGLLVAIGIAIPTALHISHQQKQALGTVSARNDSVAAALQRHKVSVLVGDYWRVLPIRLASHGTQNIMPLTGCTQPSNVLTSSAWQPDLRHHSFAYLVTLGGGNLTNFPQCSLLQITSTYGRPNATQIIAGTLTKPAEALLFYDQGSHPTYYPPHGRSAKAPVFPISLGDLPDTSCLEPTTMNVVAHQDDDLLFLSPDLQRDIKAGHCVRTVFLTAGDSGYDRFYWLSRQLGSEAAYSQMLGIKSVWEQQTVTLAPGEYVTVASPRGNSKVSLVFFNLPDGNLLGQGFPASHHESLGKLLSGRIGSMETVDGQSGYTSSQLVSALSMLMATYQPAQIHTQADVDNGAYPDHGDHIATGKFASAAATQYDQQHFDGAVIIPVTRYIGYPVHGYPGNVADNDLAQKEAAFLAYARFDGGVCQSLTQCAQTPTYAAYISRQYTEN